MKSTALVLVLAAFVPAAVLGCAQAAEQVYAKADLPGMPSSVSQGSPEWFVSPLGWESREFSEVEAGLYRLDINPVTPDSGIKTGFVIAYGHMLARPYRFETKGDSVLLVNRVQVYPELRHPRYDSATARFRAALSPRQSGWTPESLDLAHRVRDSLRALAARIAAIGPHTRQAVVDSIWRVLKAYPFIDTGSCIIEVYERDGWAFEGNVSYPIRVLRDSKTITLTPARPVLHFRSEASPPEAHPGNPEY
jgi:hypothetical protein